MTHITRHPLFAMADALKRAFIVNGFELFDDGLSPEMESSEWAIEPIRVPEEARLQPIYLEESADYAMRTSLLAAQLAGMSGQLPLKKIVCGRVFDHADCEVPAHLRIEGVYAVESFDKAVFTDVLQNVACEAFHIGHAVALEPVCKDSYAIRVTRQGDSFVLGYAGPLTPLASALIGVPAWGICIDVDAAALERFGIETRAALYSPLVDFLASKQCACPSMGFNSFLGRVSDVLRSRGFHQFTNVGAYKDDDYQKMNMIMESWDLNNRGWLMKDPMGDLSRMPTVLTPSLEDALEANFKAGKPSARIFEINHHYIYGGATAAPVERMSISFGVFGEDVDKGSFRAEVDSFLTEIGVKNHFFIPIDMAIPYDPADCAIIMDETMSYLGGQCGTVNKIALDRHGIEVPCFIFQCEVADLQKKAESEFGFVPDECK